MTEDQILPTSSPLLAEAELDETTHAQMLARRYCCEFVDLATSAVCQEVFVSVRADIMCHYNFALIGRSEEKLIIVVSDPSRLMILEEISQYLGRDLITRVATSSQLQELIKRRVES